MALHAPILEPDRHADALWITHRTPQSESMLAGRRVHWVPLMAARDWPTVVRHTPGSLAALRHAGVDVAYSTGAAVALTALPLARLAGARSVYIESLARPDGPSMTGRVLARLPWVECRTQYPANADRRWHYRNSLLDAFTVVDGEPATSPLRVFVTLGTARPWGFRRLVERVMAIVPAGTTVVWQTGVTDVGGLDLDAHAVLSDQDFQAEIARADVVVSHAGVGSFVRCLEAGRVPVLVPRRAARDEHVDDHQEQIARVGAERGLAVQREADELTFADLLHASARRVERVVPHSPSR